MPLKEYCPECGGATEYASAKPKFCSQCGNAFGPTPQGKASAAIRPKPARATLQRVLPSEEAVEEADDPNVPIPEISELDVEIKAPRRPKLTLGSVATQRPDTEKYRRPVPKQVSRKKFLEQWRKEAGSGSRSESINIGGDKE